MFVELSSNVTPILFDVEFLASVQHLLEILNPVAELTNFCQKSTTVEKWLELLENDSNELHGFVKNHLKKSNVLNTVTMTANYFHPIYRGKKLNEAQKKEVKSYIFDKLEAAGLESCRKFSEDEDIFASLQRKKKISPKTYWHYAELGHAELAAFAMDFLMIPASTAQLERLFSNWAYVHNDIRNRLSDETSKKLVNIYFTLRSAEKIDDEDTDIEFEV